MKQSLFFILICIVSLSACKSKQVITPYDYALLSAHVYNDGERELPTKFETFATYKEKEKSFVGLLGDFVEDLDVEKVIELSQEDEKGELIGYLAMKAVSGGGYHGQAYLDKNTNQLIIAHRGTDNLIDAFVGSEKLDVKTSKRLWTLVKDLDDDYEIYVGKIPRDQYRDARKFTRKVKRAYVEEFKEEPKIIHTGHSLGAVLAELCAVQDQCGAITFESPGTAPLMEELEIVSGGRFDYDTFDPNKVDITIYNAEPNQINSLHPHLGTVVPLYKEKKSRKIYSDDYLFNNIQQHSIDSLLNRFDRKTGKVKH